MAPVEKLTDYREVKEKSSSTYVREGIPGCGCLDNISLNERIREDARMRNVPVHLSGVSSQGGSLPKPAPENRTRG